MSEMWARVRERVFVGAGSIAITVMLAGPAQSYTFKVLHQFTGFPNDGAYASGGVIRDSAGNLYGTTQVGGTYWCGGSPDPGCGTIFKISPDGTETILHSFGAFGDGVVPSASLTLDDTGNLYGTAGGGAHSCGIVFKIAPDRTETVLYSFAGGSDGCEPSSGVSLDASGNLYGTTLSGGNDRCKKFNGDGCGTVYKIAPDGTETEIYAFSGKRRGWHPDFGVVVDKRGVIYGTAETGKNDSWNGFVFKIFPNGGMHIIHKFAGYPADGAVPSSALVLDKAGNIFGTTSIGGSANFGSLFKIAPDGSESLLYSFQNGTDGENPHTLIENRNGDFFGLAGDNYGPVWRLSRNGDENALYTFNNNDWAPEGNIVLDKTGTIYGTLAVGGPGCDDIGCGAVYSLTR
ncbi:MAG TPA: choice-of-anchor tandem repeat GloVer-containing protein [Rhizomicrobium sp.]|jgi:uncharacterized repeat protein (TIGR03803 family)